MRIEKVLKMMKDPTNSAMTAKDQQHDVEERQPLLDLVGVRLGGLLAGLRLEPRGERLPGSGP
jgi:hypothetical protein